jgi:hypothetical protein
MSRRAILAGGAAIPALALPAIAGPDPIFPAIAEWKRAYAHWSTICDQARAIENKILFARDEMLPGLQANPTLAAEALAKVFPELSPEDYSDPDIQRSICYQLAKHKHDPNDEHEAIMNTGLEFEDGARMRLREVAPTTQQGALALAALMTSEEAADGGWFTRRI